MTMQLASKRMLSPGAHTHRLRYDANVSKRLLIAAWWRGDHIPTLSPLPGLRVDRSDDVRLIVRLSGVSEDEAAARLRDSHRLYLGWLHDQPVAYGWSATRHAAIGEIGRSFRIPPGTRYLWDFATLPAWRGRGVYPHLLQAIIAAEREEAERFWIAYLPANQASGHGIAKAGFRPAGGVVATGRALRFTASGRTERARLGAALLGLPSAAPQR